MAMHIVDNIKPRWNHERIDKAWWTGNYKGEFTVKSAYQILRKRKKEVDWLKNIWAKGLPFKISFFLWRVWKKRIATDDNLKKMRIQIVSRCFCCEQGTMKAMTYLFLTAPIAQKLYREAVCFMCRYQH